MTALAASSLDSLQNGLTSIFSRDLLKIGWHPQWISRVIMVLVNIPAIIMAAEQYDVIALFLVADLVCATSVFPVFLGLQEKDYGILVAPTEVGAFMGCVCGIITVLVNGVVNDAEGGVFEYFWLRNDGICALCGSKTLISFLITPLVSLVATYVFSGIDVKIRGDRARRPLLSVPFDKDDRATDDGSAGAKEELESDEEKPVGAMAEEEEMADGHEVVAE